VVGAIERPPAILPDPHSVLGRRLPLADAVKAVAPHLSDESHALHVAALRRAIVLATADKREAA
jgi:aerobic carbon-monoxide dehydrogenase medium subunit